VVVAVVVAVAAADPGAEVPRRAVTMAEVAVAAVVVD
jgi:hypothetical protein